MNPMFVVGGAAAVAALIMFLGGKAGPAGAAEGDASGAGGGGKEGEGGGVVVIPGGNPLEGLGLYPSEYSTGGDSYGFAESYDDGGGGQSLIQYGGSDAASVAAAQALGWPVYNVPDYSGINPSGTAPYATDVGGQGAYITESGSQFEGSLPSWAPSSPATSPTAPAPGTPSGGYTSPQKPLLMPE